MSDRRRYRRRPDHPVIAVQLRLDTEGFSYRKWGDVQHCKAGDWLVDNDGEVYTVDAESFAQTYRQVGPGAFVKTAPVWAQEMPADGSLLTKEGRTHYRQGDYVVSNNEDGSDAYAVTAAKFLAAYEPDA